MLQAWLSEINEYAQEDVVIMLLGNKADMAGERLIKTEDGEKLAKVGWRWFSSKNYLYGIQDFLMCDSNVSNGLVLTHLGIKTYSHIFTQNFP